MRLTIMDGVVVLSVSLEGLCELDSDLFKKFVEFESAVGCLPMLGDRT